MLKLNIQDAWPLILKGRQYFKVLTQRESFEKGVVLAAKMLHFFYNTENEVSKVKRIELEDVVRLLCGYDLDAEKCEVERLKQEKNVLMLESSQITTTST